MHVIDLGQLQCLLEEHLAWRAAKKVGTSNDVADILLGVVCDYGQLVGEQPVTASKYEIAAAAGDIAALGAQAAVLEAHFTVFGAKTDGAIVRDICGAQAGWRMIQILAGGSVTILRQGLQRTTRATAKDHTTPRRE